MLGGTRPSRLKPQIPERAARQEAAESAVVELSVWAVPLKAGLAASPWQGGTLPGLRLPGKGRCTGGVVVNTEDLPRLRVLRGDAIAALRGRQVEVVVHQVNLAGVMGAGIALQIKRQYPDVFREYQTALERGELVLGGVQFVTVGPRQWVANLAGQRGFGLSARQTDYAALRMGLHTVAAFARQTLHGDLGCRVGIPYGIGCGLGGGEWSVVREIIRAEIPQATLYRLQR